jgi:hypothetical protein
MSALGREAFVAVQKIRHETAQAKPGNTKIADPWITPRQAEALLRWIDKHQEPRHG